MLLLRELDVVRAHARVDALVVIVHRDREDLLRAVLPDDVLVEDRLDLARASGSGVDPAYGSSFSTSSAMMSLQRPMHSSQM